ncbi:MAG: hypothetical protein ABIK37_00785 [candidate division WOR-3 bacterium]
MVGPSRTMLGLGVTAAVVAVAVLAISCQTPLDWTALDERTVEQNLAALATAEDAYLSKLAASSVSAAAESALLNLLCQPGVDTATISPDSTVWAIFENGLVAGICEQTFATAAGGRQPVRNLTPAMVIQSGGAVGPGPRIFAPFADELLGTALETYDVWEMCRRCYVLRDAEFWTNAAVTVQRVKAQLQDARSLFFWTGHGCLVSPFPGSPPCAALLTGRSYSQREMASAIAGELKADAQSGQQGPRIAFAAHGRRFYPAILPAFIRTYGRFENSEPYWKTVAYITACFSAYQTNPELEQAFHDAGADLFCGYDWAVHEMFAYHLDTTFVGALADTCLPLEALARVDCVTDPDPAFGRNASFKISGDTLVMLRHVLDARRDGVHFRAGAVVATGGEQANIQGAVIRKEDSIPMGQITVICPGAVGSYDIQTCDGAALFFLDERESRVYTATRGYVGTGGSIEISQCGDDIIAGGFSGILGFWNPGLIPTRDQPTAVITLADGHIKHTGWRVNSKTFHDPSLIKRAPCRLTTPRAGLYPGDSGPVCAKPY